ncbi:type I restriction endonuclease subunit R [Vibrio parahaemolyticus]|nr:type I restriction endonuclease subunit R [Vibrio parahaemolyticus]
MNNKNISLKIGLLDNGAHSLKRGYEVWNEWKKCEDAWLLKESIIWVHHGIELLLKQLLVQNNEFLVFQDVNKAVERLGMLRKKPGMDNAGVLDLFDHDDKVTSVGFKNLIDRVAITLSIDELDTKSELCHRIEQLTRFRNKIVHFSIELDVVEVSGLISDILDPLLCLLSREVSCDHFKKVTVLEIRKIAQPVQEYLKHIRSEIVSNAISATEKAQWTNKKAGVVLQVVGSGLSVTLMSYLEKVKNLDFLQEKPIFIITDRVAIAEQIYHQISNSLNVCLYNSDHETRLSEVLDNKCAHIIIATEQKLISEDFLFDDNCLLIVFNTHSIKNCLKECFPQSIRILFTSTPIFKDQDFFGELIQGHDLLRAIQDEVLKPIHISKEVPLLTDVEHLWDEAHFIESNVHNFQHARLNHLAERIVEHFESKANQKALIIVDTIDNARLILELILNLRPKWNTDGYERIQKVSHIENIEVTKQRLKLFFDANSPLSILVGTGSYFTGFDSILVSSVYITCPISLQLRYRFANLVSRSNAFEQHGEIVDFVGLDWTLE